MEDRGGAGEAEIQGLIDLVNRIWDRREETEPSLEVRIRLAPMAVYKLMPGTNCKSCGEPTCYNFALKLTAGQVDLAQCSLLEEPEYRSALDSLNDILAHAPSIGRKNG